MNLTFELMVNPLKAGHSCEFARMKQLLGKGIG